MTEKWEPVDGDTQKKRVVSFFDYSTAFMNLSSNSTQCYFYDSDIGGFHYGPGHP
jgi:histone deacetylase 1/2